MANRNIWGTLADLFRDRQFGNLPWNYGTNTADTAPVQSHHNGNSVRWDTGYWNVGSRRKSVINHGIMDLFDRGAVVVGVTETGDQTFAGLPSYIGYLTGDHAHRGSRKTGLLFDIRRAVPGRQWLVKVGDPFRIPPGDPGPDVLDAKYILACEFHDKQSGRTPIEVVRHIVPTVHKHPQKEHAIEDIQKTAAWLNKVGGIVKMGGDFNMSYDDPILNPLWHEAHMKRPPRPWAPTFGGRTIDLVTWKGAFIFEGIDVIDHGWDHRSLFVKGSLPIGKRR